MSISKHVGSTLEEFLDEEGVLAEAEAVAVKRAKGLTPFPIVDLKLSLIKTAC